MFTLLKFLQTLRNHPGWIRLSRSFLFWTKILWRTKAVWVRGLFCWIIGCAFYYSDESNNFDFRFQVRGPQKPSSDIVLIDLPEREWNAVQDSNRNIIRPLKELMNLSDSYFWNTNVWQQLLTKVLEANPASVGVAFFFGDNVRMPSLSDQQRILFTDPKIVWGADLDSTGRPLVPTFASPMNANVGIKNLRNDDDGILRKFTNPLTQIPHFAIRLVQVAKPQQFDADYLNQNSLLVNYMGGAAQFKTLHLNDVLNRHGSLDELRGKIVIIGNNDNNIDHLQTPVGRLSRAEVLANMTDNVLGKKWIGRLPHVFYLLYLALMTWLAIFILSNYPQSVALVAFVVIGSLHASISAWVFDSYYFWLPVFSPSVLLGATYIVFLSHQLAEKEQTTWRLEQEQNYLREIEHLKNNFVSMMSHDLKTPIAKIQAIVDRLLSHHPDHEFASDLKTLRRSSDELHRYIQSILHVTKVESKDFRLHLEVTDINDDIERVLSRVSELAKEKGVLLETKLEPMFSIEVDRTLIQEVILNLVENAIKYTPRDGRVTIHSQETDDFVRVIVEDTGVGIAPEEQDSIWGKFTRGKNQDLDKKGTGLGLYLVKYFVELHGGQVFLKSQINKGTQIGFSIPLLTFELGMQSEDL